MVSASPKAGEDKYLVEDSCKLFFIILNYLVDQCMCGLRNEQKVHSSSSTRLCAVHACWQLLYPFKLFDALVLSACLLAVCEIRSPRFGLSAPLNECMKRSLT